jgi:glycosyltransferase involved in cell wall biosynthesis
MSRKNPLAAVRAFYKAFSRNDKYVGLLIKTFNATNHDEWQAVQELTKNDDRVAIINKALSRQEVLSLMSCCDCFVSLHRSEGFGRIIAEAMLLEQPVIATNYSGNTDFCTKQTSYLVDGPLVTVRPGQYLFPSGAKWCDPDTDTAARRMRQVVSDPSERARRAEKGRNLIQQRYSLTAVAEAYGHRLSDLGV